MAIRKNTENTDVVYIERTVKSFSESNWHGPMTYTKAKRDGLLSSSGGTVSVHIFSEDEYNAIVDLNPGQSFA